MSLNVLKTNYFLILLTNVVSSYGKWKKRKTETTNNFAIQNLNCSRVYIVYPQTYLHRESNE